MRWTDRSIRKIVYSFWTMWGMTLHYIKLTFSTWTYPLCKYHHHQPLFDYLFQDAVWRTQGSGTDSCWFHTIGFSPSSRQGQDTLGPFTLTWPANRKVQNAVRKMGIGETDTRTPTSDQVLCFAFVWCLFRVLYSTFASSYVVCIVWTSRLAFHIQFLFIVLCLTLLSCRELTEVHKRH